MKRATIDIGSNSVLLLAGLYQDGKIQEILNESRITSLGKNLDENKLFHPESMEATFLALVEYRDLLLANGFNASETIVTATEASRVARNAEEFFLKIKNELKFSVTKISANGEAYYTALGVVTSLKKENKKTAVILDIGGASSELIKIQLEPFQILSTVSLPIGSVRATDWLNAKTIDQKWIDIERSFPLKDYLTDQLICVAGSMTSLGAIYFQQAEFNADNLEGKIIANNDFHQFLSSLSQSDTQELLKKYPYLGKRIHSIPGGVWVAQKIVKLVCLSELLISTRGLRYGTFVTGEIDGKYTC
ncbi:MAG: hypothetical protein L6Q33_05930 [Bacteriovoracaceae bacterium]|jgi:exopolyphosphatase/guanosine-5'-triphosphate,3'-diphosphate pyrophosphatase|nr:hypothetical protein [Bacteriovoracaceae bacterium]